MKRNFTLLIFLFVILLSSVSSYAQSVGDYRSKTGLSPGFWSAVSTWETFDGTSWVAASATPTSSDGVITIQSGDSIILDFAVTIDQVVIQNGANLSLFNTGTPTTFTLNDGPGDDIVNDGKLNISVGATLSGTTATILNNSDGLMNLRFSGTLAANTTNNGEVDIVSTGKINAATLTNNKLIEWFDNNINLTSGASIINNDSLDMPSGNNIFITGDATTSFINSSGAVMYRGNASGETAMTTQFTNNGTIKGLGTYDIPNTTLNNGIISPGNNSAATLTVDPFMVGSTPARTPTINLDLVSGGGVPGVNYDRLVFSMNFNTDVSGITMNVTDHASGDPVGTVYTLMTSATGNIVNTLAAANIPPSLSGPFYTATSIYVTRLVALPLIWGTFTAQANNNQTILYWTTLMEENTSHFDVQYSTDGENFSTIGTVPARGNSSQESKYTFVHTTPNLNGNNFYRLIETDLDGKEFYSQIRSVRFNNGQVIPVQVSPNPMHDVLQISVQVKDITMVLYDFNGKIIQNIQLEPGFHQLNVSGLASGAYQAVFFQRGQVLSSQQIMKW
jgi:hypothetical protein